MGKDAVSKATYCGGSLWEFKGRGPFHIQPYIHGMVGCGVLAWSISHCGISSHVFSFSHNFILSLLH